ncbi:cytochrome c [Pseudomonas sp. RIT-PI-S]|uniref:cytochrome c n=1 Tax=Pseudomonas sp. RIT-PI-S TaxID=3035295 RepID=UPI0021D9FFF3|nr:cytochrome c [Pseudomonas sp. RIT-PI-S]
MAIGMMWRPAIAPAQAPRTLDPEAVRRGALVVEAGDCAVCHTRPGGAYLAGQLPLKTPFGTLYSTNITPDLATGIGTWSLPAFERAMRQGVSRDGHLLYPAFPYVHYRRMSAEDIADAYAYLMSGPPVQAPALPNELNFPMNLRPLVSFWNLLFLHTPALQAQADRPEPWNRGRYLVEGAGHCGGCHSPLNLLGAEERGKALTGGIVDGWEAPSLLGLAQPTRGWNREQLVAYLRGAVVDGHGTPAGPMRPVSLGLAKLPDSDVQAMAFYLLSLPAAALPEPPRSLAGAVPAAAQASGEAVFQGACAGCHGAAAPMRMIDGRPALAATSALQAGSPRNFLKTVLEGIPAATGLPGPVMPPFADSLDDAQLGALAAYLRERARPGQPWVGLPSTLDDLRQEAQ